MSLHYINMFFYFPNTFSNIRFRLQQLGNVIDIGTFVNYFTACREQITITQIRNINQWPHSFCRKYDVIWVGLLSHIPLDYLIKVKSVYFDLSFLALIIWAHIRPMILPMVIPRKEGKKAEIQYSLVTKISLIWFPLNKNSTQLKTIITSEYIVKIFIIFIAQNLK